MTTLTLAGPDPRAAAAWAVKNAHDVTDWPALAWFNSSPCELHGSLDVTCQRCGIRLRRHQRIGVMWLFLALKGLLSDVVGSGKTAQVLGCLALCKETGELSPGSRCVIVCKAAAVEQWAEQVRRLLPGISVCAAVGTPQQRLAGYMGGWEVAIVSDRTFAPARGRKKQANSRDGDVEVLRRFPVRVLVYDDIDAMRNPRTLTAWAINKLAEQCVRVYGLHGTPLQKRLPELHSFLVPVGGLEALGTLARFRNRYVQQHATYFQAPAMVCPDGHLNPQPYRRCVHEEPEGSGVMCGKPCVKDETGRKVLRTMLMDGGLNPQHAEEFRRRIAPLVLRRTTDDLDDVELPEVQFAPVKLDLTPEQRRRYDELRKGTIRRLREHGEEVTDIEAQRVFGLGAQICSGTAALDEGRSDHSCKFDWLIDKLTGELDGEKMVAFVYYRLNVAALSARLTRAGIGHVRFWSEETDQRERWRRQVQFREDPNCRVLVGTTTIEQSLNLQSARHMGWVDTVLNPARMQQVAGRVRRQGSPFGTVYVHHLLARGTQEDGYLPLLRREQDLADVVWGEDDDLFRVLKPRHFMNLVAYGNAQAA